MTTVNLTGQEFASLTVIEKLGTKRVNGKMRSMYRCKCECGGHKTVSGHDLQRGDVKSCGCLVRNKRSHRGQYGSPRDNEKTWKGLEDATQMLHDILCASFAATNDSVTRYRVLGVRRHRME